ncbi:MAG: ribosomal-processing cysteine protease Prp [Acholeplasmataceae bacterium]|nr:ribosomal-processing cysteine protease Prp [Acholeplasmataceae bacterium]HOA64112.1 ribosomal-processing cysteine protease Prp [Bacilli bacterium]HPT89768.1 ribosomal-processing cysteine protease Prp [Bacilli bacterium]HQD92484.1 ribosomal-processing cysteine protease Prp [Bacilli bacterium]
MIKVEFTRNKQNEIIKVKVSGHSGYDDIGKDIVCSAVSTAMYVTIGILQKINQDMKYFENEKEAIMQIELIKTDKFTNNVMDNLQEVLESIANDYPDFIQINLK